MAVKEAPEDCSDVRSGRYPSGEPTVAEHEADGLKVVSLAPGSGPELDLDALHLQPDDPYLGCSIDGRYKVEARLGEGGMGVVYRCRHKIIGKQVAMKVLRADLARDLVATERFLNEAKAASSIGNPHIIDISDFGQFQDGATYFVMEYLDGLPLSSVIGDGQPLPVERLLLIAEQLAEGLSAAHRAQIVHRDLKPDNIFLVTRGQSHDFVKILDFGIAKVSNAEGGLTRAGAVFGTPHYMSPEQAAGSPVDNRGDIYSLGVIMYEMASGRVPFDADNFMGILSQHIYKSPVPIGALVPPPEDVPAGLEAIILKCMSKLPEMRYQSMDDVLEDLTRLRQGEEPGAIGDLMSRSADFNLPPNYFRDRQIATSRTMSMLNPVRGRRWPLVTSLAVGAGALSVMIGMAVSSNKQVHSPPLSAAPAVPPRSAVSTFAHALRPAPQARVVLAVEPLDADVFHGDDNLGQSPVIVEVPSGATLELEIRREGYRTEKLMVDGSQKKRSIRLTAVNSAKLDAQAAKPAVKAKRAAPPKPRLPETTSPTLNANDIVDPWARQ